jgi:hypothetical protein
MNAHYVIAAIRRTTVSERLKRAGVTIAVGRHLKR